jgi:hypothetical protein
MDRTELMVGEEANRIRAGLRAVRVSRNCPNGESLRVPDDRMLWKGKALMRFAPFPTINSVLTNAAEVRLQSCHVFGVQMEKRSPMTERDVSSEHPNLNEGCEHPQVCTPRTPRARGSAVAETKTNINLNCNDAG